LAKASIKKLNHSRSLFVLPVIGKDRTPISDAATLSGYVARLENAFYELAQNYYHQVANFPLKYLKDGMRDV
jgi:hypothetical protein